jgi:hypothetical protein
MNLGLNLNKVVVTEFGVGIEDSSGERFVAVPVDAEVQNALLEMVRATQTAIDSNDGHELPKYEASEKYGSTDCLVLPLNDDLAQSVRQLHEAGSLPIDSGALSEPALVYSYFVRLTDNDGKRVTGVRRAAHFKGVVRCKNRLVRMLDDTLRIVEDTLFRLDSDFDFLIDGTNVFILRPSGFESVGKLQQAILAAVPQNISQIRADLSFVVFDGLEAYASGHPRAARYLASIRGQGEAKSVDRVSLASLCKCTGVDVTELDGKLQIAAGHELGFLEVLDRRRYEVGLMQGQPEHFKAASRTKLAC